uniref:Uncharacterized protein n=1 Tax=Arundo donax TaxID=35708 RepID=A0A0A9CY48_ARUDO
MESMPTSTACSISLTARSSKPLPAISLHLAISFLTSAANLSSLQTIASLENDP